MRALIANVLISVVRFEANQDYISLGMVLASSHISRLSYLWSLELWSAMTSSTLLTRRTIFIVVLVPLLSFLAAVVGPSSPVAMIPRQTTSKPFESSYGPIGSAILSQLFPSPVDDSYNMTA